MPNIEIGALEPVHFDIKANDLFIAGHGIPLTHYKAIVCPSGVTDALDGRSSHSGHSGCSNGYIYEYAGQLTAFVYGNSSNTDFTDVGVLDGSIMTATFPRFYDDKKDEQVYVQLYDRFYIKESAILVPNSQKVEAHISGVDKFTYNIEKVESLIDERLIKYDNSLYVVENGTLRWLSENRPGYDLKLGRGTIYSIRYLYTPYFYVSRLMHEVRIFNQKDFKTGAKTPTRVNYQALLSREYYLHKDEKKDSVTEDTRRDLISPRSNTFGPR